ncbi:SEL1-like repeat protein [Acetobacteraceae bacterium]|nr:SEL1-like repeat protein [Acetobacteraceae bacterium]
MKRFSLLRLACVALPTSAFLTGCVPNTDYAMLSPTLQDEALRAEKGDTEAQFRLGWMYQHGINDTKTNLMLRQNLSESVKWYRKAATRHNVLAQDNLAWMYMNGQGVRQNFSSARKWYQRAARNGNVKAEYALGLIYATDVGKHQNFAKAIYWLTKASEHGFHEAELCLGYIYETLPVNPLTLTPEEARKEAFAWYKKAADHGFARGQLKLGEFYADGTGVKQDKTEAFYWLSKAREHGDPQAEFALTHFKAEEGDAKAQFELGEMYRQGKGTHADLGLALQSYQKSAWQNYAPAQYAIARLYAQGQGAREDRAWASKSTMEEFFPQNKVSKEDQAKAIQLFTRAAAQGDARSEFALGVAYEYGIGVSEDGRTAISYYQKAAEKGEPRAQLALGKAYMGEHVLHGGQLAGKWLKKAADQGLPEAQFKLGQLYDNGQGEWPQDHAKAVEYYRLAHDKNYVQGSFALARAYEEGLGVAFNPALAAQIYQGLADKNIPEAQYKIGEFYETGTASKDAIEGIGLPVDQHAAASWYRRSAHEGYAKGQFAFGMAQLFGKGTALIPARGLFWIEKAADQGDAQAQFTLGKAYIDKRLPFFNRAKSVTYFEKAADQGHASAQFALGLIHSNKENHLYYDEKKAQKYFCLAAAQGIVSMEEVPERLADTVMRNRKSDLKRAVIDQKRAIAKINDDSFR